MEPRIGKKFSGGKKSCVPHILSKLTAAKNAMGGGEAVQNAICSITVKCVYNNARVQSPSFNASLFSFYKDCECVNLVIEFVCITGP